MKPKYDIEFREEEHEYYYNGIRVPCVSDILTYFGLIDLKYVPKKMLEESMDFGSNMHKTCQLSDTDDLAKADLKAKPYLEGWEMFKNNNSIKNSDFKVIEQPLYSKVWNFAGTPDRATEGHLYDIKTGCSMPYHAIQTAFYQILLKENFNLKIKERCCVHLKPFGFKLEQHKNKSDISIAKSLVQIYNWKKLKGLL